MRGQGVKGGKKAGSSVALKKGLPRGEVTTGGRRESGRASKEPDGKKTRRNGVREQIDVKISIVSN